MLTNSDRSAAMRRFVAPVAALLLAAAAGCGGPNIAAVSGVVKLDGKPYKHAVVSFQPIGDKDNQNPGRGSAGLTDENGRYTLIYNGESPGAIIGPHRVRIFTKFAVKPPPDDKSESAPGAVSFREPIPAEWHELSTKSFDVPRGGTDKADFDISTKSAAKK